MLLVRTVQNGYVVENMSNATMKIATSVEDLLVHIRDMLAVDKEKVGRE